MHGVHTAVGQADIVEDVIELTGWDLLPDGLLDQVTKAGCLLDPSPVFPRTCKMKLPPSVLGKKSWPSHGTTINAERQTKRKSGTKIRRLKTTLVSNK